MRPAIHTGRRAHRERGAALLTAMVAVAVLTALAVDLAYTSRVSLQIAANGRDELRAHYLARSGVAMGRLVLSFQQKLDESPLARTGGVPRVQLFNLIPVGPSFTDSLFGGPGAPAPPVAQASLFGDAPKGAAASRTWDAVIDDEGRKVNAQLDGFIGTGDLKVRQKAQALYQLMCDGRWDPLFDREDAHGQRTSREDLLVRLRDWVNEKEASSELAIAGGAGAACGLVVGQPPFVEAFGDKNQPYDRLDERYKTKNARMDSIDELYLVAGIGDAFMAAFGDALTVYLPRDAKRNVNVMTKQELLALAASMADPPGQPALLQDEFAEKLVKSVRERTFGGILSLTAKEVGLLVETAGVHVNANLLADGPNSPFTDRSTVFRIRANGKSGAVTTSIDAVVWFDTNRQPGEQLAQPGRIIHWRED